MATAAAMRPERRIGWAGLGLATLGAAGLWTSFSYALSVWKADPDIFVAVELWRGVGEHGLGFVRTWGYTADNWLFSLIPLASAAYALFGVSARTAVLTGWGFFLASAGLTAALAAKVAGPRPAAILGPILLFANLQALGHVGFLAYPISHNVSLAWGLAALLLAVWSLETRAYGSALAAAALLFVSCVSDPWASAALAAPLILVSGAIALRNRRDDLGRPALVLCLVSAAAFWIAHKHPFGLLHFLRRGDFQPGDAQSFAVNLRLGYEAVAAMFNLAPAAGAGAAVRAASFVAALALVAASGARVARSLRGAGIARQLVGGVSILSILAVTVLYLAGPANSGLYVGRFFPNLYFLGGLLAAMAAADGGRWSRAAAGAYAALFVLAGAASAPSAWTAPPSSSDSPKAQALGAFLRSHGLSYGYGPFWGAQALVMRTATLGAVTIRPVTFHDGRVARRRIESSRLWYEPQAEPPGRVFLAIVADGEACLAVATCEMVARRQFGAPVERLTQGETVVLVWDRPLAARIAP